MNALKRDEKGRLVKGTPPGPGRPKGQSLKEYWRMKFQEMTPEEKEAFSQKVGLDTIWRMAEGNPHSTIDEKQDITITPVLVKFVDGKSN